MRVTWWVPSAILLVAWLGASGCHPCGRDGGGAATPKTVASSSSSGPAVVAPASPTTTTTTTATTPTTARTPAECRACNGVWGVHGIAPVESCDCRTTDGGKRCRDGADCQGMCVAADVPERDIVSAGPPARGFFVGRCSEIVTVFGCNRFIERGAVARGPVQLDDPPGQICVD